mmetsp:Transcript_18577/g.44418  ORF Transcript_18577/g.44418 Transcript_18577/m.44418 type:complete len:204 (-) Transcript_18577:584-1195(-)
MFNPPAKHYSILTVVSCRPHESARGGERKCSDRGCNGYSCIVTSLLSANHTSRYTLTFLRSDTGMSKTISRSLRFSPWPFFLPCLLTATSARPHFVSPPSESYSIRRKTLVSGFPSSRVYSTCSGSGWKRVRSSGSRSTRSAPGDETSTSMAPAASSPSSASSPADIARETRAMSSSEGDPYSSSSLSTRSRTDCDDGAALNE